MLLRLKENEHKKDFKNRDLLYISSRIEDETNELDDELYYTNIDGCPPKFSENIDYKAARREFADIANFAHMGILACDKKMSCKE